MNKIAVTLSFLFAGFFAHATNYYVKVGGGTGNGLTDGTAWSYAKYGLMASSLLPGDSVFLNRGDTFYGVLPTPTGSSSARFYIGAYGTGANPVCTGFETLTSWTSEGSGVYSASITATAMKSVLFDGTMQPMGRYPNAGYLTITAAASNTSFTVGSLTGTWIGAVAVVRTNRYVMDAKQITAQTGTALTTQALTYKPATGYGMFIQGSRATLDQLGEWSYDAVAHKLYVYFGGGGPGGHEVKAASLSEIVKLNAKTYLTLENIDFEGAYTACINVSGSDHLTINNCNIRYGGVDGVVGSGTNLAITRTGVAWNNAHGLNISGSTPLLVDSNTIRCNGVIPGAGASGSGGYRAVSVNGNNNMTITRNIIDSSGYVAIHWQGNDVLISRNKVTNFCLVLDDGGGIYTAAVSDSTTTRRNRTISSNIVVTGGSTAYVGTTASTTADYGIYLDDNTNNVTVTGNTVVGCGAGGLYVHNTNRCTITGNRFFNNGTGMIFRRGWPSGKANIYNLTVSGNEVLAKTNTQICAEWMQIDGTSISLFGPFTNNVYSRPVSQTNYLRVQPPSGAGLYYTVSSFQSAYTMETGSLSTPSGVSLLAADQLYDYNATDNAAPKEASWYFKTLSGTQYGSSYTLPGWGGVVGIKMNPQPTADATAPTLGSSTITASSTTQTGTRISWTAATDNVTTPSSLIYTVYLSASDNLTGVSNAENNGTLQTSGAALTSATLSGLSAGTTYYANVVVSDGAGNKTAYSRVSFTTLPSLPATPGAPTIGTITSTTVAVTVSLSSGATTARLYRATSTSGPDTLLKSGLSAGSTTDATVLQGLTYYYRQSGVNASGEGSLSAYSSGATVLTDVALPGVPPAPTVTGTTVSSVSLTINSATGATGYNVYRATSATGTYTKITSSPVSAGSYTDGGLTANTTYYYKVTAVNGSGESARSPEVYGTTNTVIKVKGRKPRLS